MPRQDKDSGFLYHYTDFHALDGILRMAQLRLNNILNMNDAAEMRLFMGGLCAAIIKRLGTDGMEGRAEEVKGLFRDELKKEFFYSAYAACFSLYRDDAAQWERYGNRGRGVCIAFEGELLKKMAEQEDVVSLQTVFYQDDMTEHKLVETFCAIIKDTDSLTDDMKRVRSALNDAWICSAAFKHPSFASEREVRLVASPFEKGYFDVKPCYHVSAERIKKYYPLDLHMMCEHARCDLQDLICEIIIGPESTQSQPILQDYLEDNGLKRIAKKVYLSDCPLRSPT